MKKVICVICMLCIVQVGAQTTFKRYKKKMESSVNNSLVQINLFSAKSETLPESPKYKSIYDLTDRGQASVLTNRNPAEAADLLNKKFLTEPTGAKKIVDLSVRNIQVTFSISRTPDYTDAGFNPYDKIEYLDYTFTADPALNANVKFIKWNKLSTEYGTLDVGTLEFNQSFSASLSATGKFGASVNNKTTTTGESATSENTAYAGSEISPTAAIGYGNSKKELQSVKQRFIQLTGALDSRKFNIKQQGTRDTELAGNVTIDLTVKTPVNEAIITSFTGLYDPTTNLAALPSAIKMSHIRYWLPDVSALPNGIKGKLDHSFAVRHILKNEHTYSEFDDKVQFITGGVKDKPFTLITKDQLNVPVYFIQITGGGIRTLTFDLGGAKQAIQFISYEEAFEFVSWLKEKLAGPAAALTVNGRNITFEGTSLADQSITNNSSTIGINTQ